MLHGMTPAKLLNSTLNTKIAKEEYRGVITIPQIIKKANPTILLPILENGTYLC